MKAFTMIAASLALAALPGCMQGQGGRNGHAEDLPAARAIGAAQSCIPINQISESRVRDDWTIDFRTGANRWYRNSLPQRCSGLGFEKAFSYSTSLTQLCSTDIIRVISSTGGGLDTRGACGLGQFVPVELVR